MYNKKTSLKVYSPNLVLLAEIDDYTSFIIKRCYNETGDFSLNIGLNKQNTKHLQKNNIIIIDSNGSKSVIIKYRECTLDEEGKETLVIKGYALDCILNQRTILLPLNENELIYTGNSGQLISKLVNDNIANSSEPLRNIENLINENSELGENIIWQLKSVKLGDEISKVAKINSLGYKIITDTKNKKLIFKVYAGKDLSCTQSVNPKVLFSPELTNIKNMKYIDSAIEEKNVIYVDVKSGFPVPYCNQQVSGIDRMETYLSHGELKETETIEDLGKNELANYPGILSINAEIVPNVAFIYEQDYSLGDIVTIRNKKWGISKDLRITSIEEVYETTNKINITFGEPQPTFIKRIRNYITNMS
jgi:hypothetical protein